MKTNDVIRDASDCHSGKAHGPTARVVGLCAAILALLAAGMLLPLSAWSQQMLAWIGSLGPAAPVAFGIVYVLFCVLVLPGFILTVGAGALFGVLTGTIVVSIAETLGATAAFLIARYLARDVVAARLAASRRLKAFDEAIAQRGWKIVVLLRLSPVFPWTVINYALGLTRISLVQYVLASWLGMLPGTILYVYAGSLAGSLAKLEAEEASRSPAEWVLYVAGLLITVALTLYLADVARRTIRDAAHR
ncbi:MAG: TVP38/TMEM64 family protein [Candidatus Hydrogenedentes bacterium]|nr:TVP38/TMEM64 family protein [Candidatus Hydrogenedentota bacterium]